MARCSQEPGGSENEWKAGKGVVWGCGGHFLTKMTVQGAEKQGTNMGDCRQRESVLKIEFLHMWLLRGLLPRRREMTEELRP